MTLDELKSKKIHVIWHYEDRKGQKTKVPKSINLKSTGVSENYEHTYATYEDAVKAKDFYKYNGVMFKLPPNMFFADFDKKDKNDPLVKEMCDFNTYGEESTSRSGYHFYGLYDPNIITQEYLKDFYMNNRDIKTELYFGSNTNRFVACTEYRINNFDFVDCTDKLKPFLEKHMRRKVKTKPIKDTYVKEIVKSLRKQKNADKFIKLYDEGDFSKFYGSHSEADIALVSMIAWKVGPDKELIDRIFRTSGLYREKWERDDYRNETIEKAIASLDGKFSIEQMPHPYFIEFDDKGNIRVNPALLAKYVKERIHFKVVKGRAKEANRIYVYDDNYYKLYDVDMFQSIIKGFIKEYREDIVRTSYVVEAYKQLILDGEYIKQEEFDNDESLINFNNCILKIEKDKLTMLPHSHEYLLTTKINCDFVPEEIDNIKREVIDIENEKEDMQLPKLSDERNLTPNFDSYIYTLSNNDRRIENLFLEIMGVVISNVKAWRMKAGCITYGDGDTGKSKIRALTEEILGDENYATCDLKDIEEKFGTSAIYNTRLAGTSDSEYINVSQLNIFKRITGGDKIKIEYKGENQFSYRYNGFIWICGNRLIRFSGDDGKWVYDRFIIIECKNVIPKEKQDRELLDKMIKEKTGIVHRAVLALQNVLRNGYRFTEPKSVKDARIEYMDENSPVRAFYKECVIKRPSEVILDNVTVKKMYDLYVSWSKSHNNGYAKKIQDFRYDLKIITGIKDEKEFIKHCKDGNYFRYLTVKYSAVKTYDPNNLIGITISESQSDTDIEEKNSIKYTDKYDESMLKGFTPIEDIEELPFA